MDTISRSFPRVTDVEATRAPSFSGLISARAPSLRRDHDVQLVSRCAAVILALFCFN
jgi:hypothetical protein